MAGKAPIKIVKQARQLRGEITVPGDKSISHRAIILSSIASGISEISNLSTGSDCISTLNCMKNLGIKLQKKPNGKPHLLVHGTGYNGLSEAKNILYTGNSGTAMRLLSGVLAAQPFLSIINGDISLRARPMKRLIEPLRLMGAEIYGRGHDSFAPLVIKGRSLNGINYSLPVPSAQIKSAILLAGLFAKGKTTIEQNQISRDHTERLLQQMGVKLDCDNTRISMTPVTTSLKPMNLYVPGDISSAAFWMVAGAIHPNAKIKIQFCGINPTRTGLIDILQNMGARIRVENKLLESGEPVADVYVESSQLTAVEIDKDVVPRVIDEIPILCVAACFAKGKTVIRDAGELRVKESDRITTTVSELYKLGATIEALPDGMLITGSNSLIGAEVKSYSDHRLAMSLAVASLVAKGETVIHNPKIAEISYPSFWEELSKISTS
jgi:3-phosphoshikimate 1-carboxyvinyltransferase